MSVEIDPAELGFRRPFTVEVARTLRIRNTNATPVAFKVKTTAPKQYCVRPNSGRIEPDRDVEVSVLLQAMKQDPEPDTKCRDKFLVQSVPITGDKEFVSVQDIWDSVEKSSVQEKKIRVVFLPAESGNSSTLATPVHRSTAAYAADTPEVNPPPYQSPRGDENLSNSAQFDASSSDIKEERSEVDDSPSLYPAAALASVKEMKDTTVETLKAQLAQAEAMIASLKNGEGLRQRKGASPSTQDKSAPAAQQLQQAVRQGTEGVPVKIVAGLCLLSFLLAYFFF